MSDINDRLDSWKAIAEYLNRDIRTLRRWEEEGLPVRRVPGGRGNSVFAFKSEIDAWLRASGPDRPKPAIATVAPVKPPVVLSEAAPVIAPPPAATPRSSKLPRRALATAVVFAVIFFGWKTFAPNAAPEQLDIRMSGKGLVVSGPKGDELWRYDFPETEISTISTMSAPWFLGRGARPAIFAMTSYQETIADKSSHSGLLRQFSLDGKLQQTFEMQDRWTFGGKTYESPWALTDFKVDDSFGHRQVAVAGHHYTWWPSIVTVLDERFQRQGTFVNSGWVDNLRWLSPDRLAISGFNEALDGGMLGVLNVHDIDGSSPEAPGSPFVCDDCRPGLPENYVVFPRSELNRVTGSRFNRTFVEVVANRIIARSDEVAREDDFGGMVEAVYEFSTDMTLLRATYGSRYWDKHRALEMEGRLKHSREACPEREGPPIVKVWTKAGGWRDVHPPR